MKLFHSKTYLLVIILGGLVPTVEDRAQTPKQEIHMDGLSQSVEIIKDIWGISHIYAQNQKDLFFAQGFNVARDRLFQLEIWRRQATGTMAEILGERVLESDIGARLFKYRGDMQAEMAHYHAAGPEIITSFIKGINAYIDLTREKSDLLPMEFQLLGIKPEHWTPEVVVSRHNGLYRNVTREVSLARRVALLGADAVKEFSDFQPDDPQLNLVEESDVSLIPDDVLDLYRSRRLSPGFHPEDIVDPAMRNKSGSHSGALPESDTDEEQGSNNWVVSGDKTFSRYPIMANDPHRTQQIPSLRYFVHLSAPGWNVIGGGEPALPGLSIGHNEHGAWGLTIFSIDQEDLYVYDTNPTDPDAYRYQGKWEYMTIIKENIPIKGKKPIGVELKYTRHGPVVFEDVGNRKAYAVRAAWLEIGSAPYLASLRMDQARSWEEFRDACHYSRTPSENMVWADRYGNIGWQAVGIAPIRENWFGLLPVPGDGQYEWDGFVPIENLPHVFNPPDGYIATANENNIPYGYPFRLGYSWAEPFRVNRIKEILESGQKFTIADLMRLQQDELSIPARNILPLFKGLQSDDENVNSALQRLLHWDCVMDKHSVEATIYSDLESRLRSNIWALFHHGPHGELVPRLSLARVIQELHAPDRRFGPDPVAARDALLLRSLEQTIQGMIERLDPDMDKWQYGQEKVHYIKMRHILSRAVNEKIRSKLDLDLLPRGGSSATVNNTGSGNQRSGASFRIIADTGHWDNSVGTNNPGQSGNPDSPHYSDLYEMWANGDYFPLLFGRSKIEQSSERKIVLVPVNSK